MTAAGRFGSLYLAAASVLALGLMLSYRSGTTPAPHLEFSWLPETRAPTLRSTIAPAAPASEIPKAASPVIPATEPGGAVAPAHAPGTVPVLPPPGPAEIARVRERLEDNLTQDLYDDFKLFLYVDKAASGPSAQQMYVFRKARDGELSFLNDWPVSTGREQVEFDSSGARMLTHTPPGYYELDPHRFFVDHLSGEWHQPMPYAMFFNWIQRGSLTGLAIHGATGSDVAKLGRRASAGCIHLSPGAARTLFNLIRSQYRGAVPRFAIDHDGTMSNAGLILRDADGRSQFAPGYKVLVFIENYGGRNVIAAMY